MQSRSLHPTDAEHKGFGHSPTSILQRKWCLYRQTHCLQEQRIVYTSALLADTVKPLNVLSKFENHFAIRTVRFQVQLEADGYFLLRRFLRLHPQQAGIQHKNALVSRLNDRWTSKFFEKNSFQKNQRWFIQYHIKPDLLLPVLKVKSGTNRS